MKSSPDYKALLAAHVALVQIRDAAELSEKKGIKVQNKWLIAVATKAIVNIRIA